MNNIDFDFTPEMLQLNYELTVTQGKLDGTRYPTTKNTKRIKRHKDTNASKQRINK